MATGFIPLETGGTFTGFICYYSREASNTAASWSHTVYGYIRDYLSYSSGTFTVLKGFSASIMIYGKGSYNEKSGGGGRTISYSFKKTSGGSTTVVASGSAVAGGSKETASVSFATGDTFTISLSISGTVGNGSAGMQCGFFMSAI